jgi:hypothetical protein
MSGESVEMASEMMEQITIYLDLIDAIDNELK